MSEKWIKKPKTDPCKGCYLKSFDPNDINCFVGCDQFEKAYLFYGYMDHKESTSE